MSAGFSVEPADIGTVTLSRLVRFAGASGDMNRLHYDFDFARAAGFDGPIMHGLLGGALLASVVAGERRDTPKSWRVRFRRPVPIDAQLQATLRINGDDGTAELYENGELASIAEMSWTDAEPSDSTIEPLSDRFRWVVEQGAVREYALATEFPAPPPPGEPIPIMAIGLSSRWSPEPVSAVSSLGFDYRRMLHRQSEYQLFGSGVAVGETLWVETGLGERMAHTGRDGVPSRVGFVVTEVRDDDGGLRARASHEMLERGEPR